MVTQTNLSLSAKRESLSRIHGRYQRAGRLHKTRILDEFCAMCGYHRKSALRLLHRPLVPPTARARPGPKRIYDPLVLLPVLKVIWLSSDPLCSKLLRAALPEWLEHYERQLASDTIPEANKTRLREEHQRLDSFALKKSLEGKLKKFFTALGHLDRESTKT